MCCRPVLFWIRVELLCERIEMPSWQDVWIVKRLIRQAAMLKNRMPGFWLCRIWIAKAALDSCDVLNWLSKKHCFEDAPIPIIIFITVILALEPSYEGLVIILMTLYYYYRSIYAYDSLVQQTLRRFISRKQTAADDDVETWIRKMFVQTASLLDTCGRRACKVEGLSTLRKFNASCSGARNYWKKPKFGWSMGSIVWVFRHLKCALCGSDGNG